MARVIIGHGYGNMRPVDHWQYRLAGALRKAGHQVFYPQFPTPEAPDMSAWREVLLAEYRMAVELGSGGESGGARVESAGAGQAGAVVEPAVAGQAGAGEPAGPGELLFIGHSLGCINWLMVAVAGGFTTAFDRVLLVAPADVALLRMVQGIALDLDSPGSRAAVQAAAGRLTLVASENDFWLPGGVQSTYGDKLHSEVVIVPGAGHFSRDDGFGNWQGVVDWATSQNANLAIR